MQRRVYNPFCKSGLSRTDFRPDLASAAQLTMTHFWFPYFWPHSQETPCLALCPSGLASGAEAKRVGLGSPPSELLPKAVHGDRGPQPSWGTDRDLFLGSEEGQNRS